LIADIGLAGWRAMMTKGSSGIGIEIARVWATVAASITLAVRGPKAGEPVAAATGHTSGPVGGLDLASLSARYILCSTTSA
jgi:NAD(P)-dependent dehydrogenase (short-subunit alcohol dehydrogenase family)